MYPLLIVIALLSSAVASPIAKLPAGEDPAQWRSAFAFAGLADDAEATIYIEATHTGWQVRVSTGNKTVRTANVSAPRDARGREEIALVAAGLIRDMAHASAPPQVLAPPPPPPPPPPPKTAPHPKAPPKPRQTPATARPIEAAPLPSAEPPSGVPTEAPTPPDTPEPSGASAAEEAAETDAAEDIAPIVVVDLDGPPERKARRVSVAPIGMGLGLSTRPNTAPAALVFLGSRIGRSGPFSADLNLKVLSLHSVRLEGARPVFSGAEGHVAGVYRFNRVLSAGPLAGLSYRTFSQDNLPLEQIIMPEVGLLGSVTFLGGRWWGLRLVTQATWDVGTVRLQPAGSPEQSLSHFSVKSYFSIVFGDRVDPFVERRTSRE
jgi:hypothetical protein